MGMPGADSSLLVFPYLSLSIAIFFSCCLSLLSQSCSSHRVVGLALYSWPFAAINRTMRLSHAGISLLVPQILLQAFGFSKWWSSVEVTTLHGRAARSGGALHWRAVLRCSCIVLRNDCGVAIGTAVLLVSRCVTSRISISYSAIVGPLALMV